GALWQQWLEIVQHQQERLIAEVQGDLFEGIGSAHRGEVQSLPNRLPDEARVREVDQRDEADAGPRLSPGVRPPQRAFGAPRLKDARHLEGEPRLPGA